jgi:hypothetical protein
LRTGTPVDGEATVVESLLQKFRETIVVFNQQEPHVLITPIYNCPAGAPRTVLAAACRGFP